MYSKSLRRLKFLTLQFLLLYSFASLPQLAKACDGSGYIINNVIDNGDGTFTIDMDIVIAGFDHTGGILGGTQGFFFNTDRPVVSIAPPSLTSVNGTTLTAVLGGTTITWGTPGAGPYFVLPSEPTQTFNVQVTVTGRPLAWNGGGMEDNNCPGGAGTSNPSPGYSGTFPCPLATIAPVGGDQTICEGQSVTLGVAATGEDLIVWSPDGQTGSTITVTPTVTTTYTAVATNDCGDVNTSITITVDPLPMLTDLTGDQTICFGETANLTILSLFEDNITWIPTGDNGYSISVMPANTTTYTVIATNACGTDQLDLEVEVIPFPTVIPDIIQADICAGEILNLDAFVENEDFITWTPGGSTTNSQIVSPTQTTVYTILAGNFCEVVSADITVNVTPEPDILTLTPDLSVCSGEVVTLGVDTLNADQILWTPSGETGNIVTITPTMPVVYSVQVSNQCGDTVATVQVDIEELPELSIVNGDQSICDGETVTLSVTSTNANSVTWTPGGLTGNSISVSPNSTTTYTVVASNDCGDELQNITVSLVPEVTSSLTLETCEGTTATYQGTSLAIGSVTDFTLTGPNGCDSVVTVTVDGINTLTSNLTLEACDGTDAIYEGTSLPPGSMTDFTLTATSGCDSIVTVTVDQLPLFTTSLTLETCDGTTADYNGNPLAVGTTTDFGFTAANGCDSTVSVTVDGLQNFTTPLTLEACDGNTADYNGNALAIGTTTDFSFTANNGCDSTVSVTVDGLQNFTTPLTLEACDGNTADYNGNALAIGTTTDFSFTANNGCDSTVSVTVDGLQNFTTPLTLEACDGNTADYNGNALAIGTTTDFSFTANNGCDSTVSVTVDGLQNFTTPLTLEACDGNTADYNGNALAIGTTTDFSFTANNGCDSTVSVTVDGLQTFTSALTLETCDGTTTSYEGSTLAVGSVTDFTLTADNGCDSVVTVTVNGISVFTSNLTLETCDGTTASYEGSDLPIGSVTDFTFTASSGCDSIVTVTVDGISAFFSTVDLEACDGNTADYNGNPLAIGTSTNFTLTAASGCDSIVTVTVQGLDTYNTPLQLSACQGEDADYNGNALAIGSITDFSFTAANGCDSTVTVAVLGLDTYAEPLQLQTCLGTDIVYNGTPLSAGSVTDFNFTAANGCDSLVTVSVDGIDAIRNSLNLETCDGTEATYEGTSLAIGSSTDFTFTANNGCDSIVTVSISGISAITNSLNLETCDGTEAVYEGTNLAIGSSTDFTFTASSNGCDSIVTVTVSGVTAITNSLNLETCDGTEAVYEGTNLPIGSSTDFTFTASSSGCDSIVTVIVSGIPILTSSLNLETCDGTEAVFNGTNLPIGSSTDFTLTANSGCDSIVTVLVGALPTFVTSLQLEACEGNEAIYNGTPLSIGSSTDFGFTAANGCDSTVTVAVAGLINPTGTLQLEACDGTSAVYDGQSIPTGTSADFTLTASNGCDSLLTVIVDPLPNFASSLQLQTCQGTEAVYEGQNLAIGSTTDFTLTANNGCDSVVTVSVIGLNTLMTAIQLEACDGTEALYNGTPLPVGSSTDFNFIASSGCDSIVTVSVAGLQNFSDALTLDACDGTTAIYEGQQLAIGSTTDFSFTAANGCDSTVSVSVQGLQVFASALQLDACDGTTAIYEGQQLAIGSSTDFTFTANNGCDSVVSVSVQGLQVFNTPLTLDACDGTTADYNGTALDIGTTTDFTFTSINGCDSIVSVTVQGLQNFASALSLDACEGTTASYNGQSLAIGSVTDFTLTATNGCDSVVTVSVAGLEVYEIDEVIETCEDTPITFDGVIIPAGGNQAFTYTSALGCDSIVTVFASDVLTLSSSNEEVTICNGDMVEVFGQMVSTAGAYSDIFTNTNGCDSTHTVFVDVLSEIELTSESEPSCPDENTGILVVETSGGMGPYNFNWNNGAQGEELNNLSAGLYTLTVTDAMGCTETIDLEVTTHQAEVEAIAEDVNCFGDDDGVITITNPNPEWVFSLENRPFTSDSFFVRLTAGTYQLTTQDAFGCLYNQRIEVAQPGEFVLSLPSDTTIQLGQSVPISANHNAFGNLAFNWNTTNFLDCDSCLNPLATPVDNILYVLSATDENGCEAQDEIFIVVENQFQVYIPNAFSPNNDGQNEEFMIFAAENVISNITSFKVFSRWGELLFADFNFQPNDPTHSWDGVFKGDLMNPAVFVYFAEIEFIDGTTKLFKGDVTLLK
ncbi:MAG: gliding motility-associated C-terminal domain-containing protein [Bacteroidota bacterium]